MGIEIIQPKDEAEWLQLRTRDITSTETAALFDASPYITKFELWFRKRDKTIVTIEANDRVKWGRRLEQSIAAGVAEDQGWSIRKMSEYIRDPELRMGASFDFAIGNDGILEVKNVDSLAFRDGWIVDGENVEAPAHIEAQAQSQLAVSGRSYAWIAALIGGNKVVLIRRERDEKVIAAIKAKVKEFWESIDRNEEPSPDFKRDSGFIASMYSFAEPGKIVNADAELIDLATAYKAAQEEESKAKAIKEEVKARILMRIGDAERVKGEAFSISAGMIGPKHVEYDAAGYRSFRVTFKKVKEAVA